MNLFNPTFVCGAPYKSGFNKRRYVDMGKIIAL